MTHIIATKPSQATPLQAEFWPSLADWSRKGPAMQRFAAGLPAKPYAFDGIASSIRPAVHALAHYPGIQFNTPWLARYITIDIDGRDPVEDWPEYSRITPNLFIANADRPGYHALFELREPVHQGQPQARKWLANITQRLTEYLDGDQGYTGLLCKNPLARQFNITAAWNRRRYTLAELDRRLPQLQRTNAREIAAATVENLAGIQQGQRNTALFDVLRFWAYRAYPQMTAHEFEAAAVSRVLQMNSTFAEPLRESEARATAKSVVRFCLSGRSFAPGDVVNRGRDGNGATRHLDYKSGQLVYDFNLPERLSTDEVRERRRIAAERTNAQRVASNSADMAGAVILRAKGLSKSAIARQLGVPRTTVNDWLKSPGQG